MTPCKHCTHLINGKFCSNCGQAATLKRIDGHYVKHEIEHLIHFEKGIFYTIKELLLRPGQSVKSFIHDDRNRLVKPIIFVIVASLIYTITTNFFGMTSKFISISSVEGTSLINVISVWLENYLGYANIVLGMFMAFWIKLFFKEYNYNFFEILVLMCFVMGMGMLIASIFAVISEIIKTPVGKFAGVVYLVYCCWAIAQFFDKSKVMSYVKSIITFILGWVSFTIIVLGLGISLDWLMKI